MRPSLRLVSASLLTLGLAAGLASTVLAAETVEPASAAAGEDEVVAKVNGQPIKLSDIALADEEMGQALARLPEELRFQYLLGMLIDRRIVAQAAKDKKMQDDPMVKRREAYYDEKALRDVYWVQLMRDKVGEKAVKAYYDEHIAKAEPEVEAHAAHILVGTKAEAQKVLSEIKGGKTFEDVAKATSKDSSSQEGGDLGWFKKGDMVPEFANAVFSMKPGQVSEPVQTKFGWHVIKLIETRKSKRPTLDEAHDDIMRTLAREQGTKTIEALRKKSKIEIVGGGDGLKPQMAPAPQ
ncbi:MAG: peptidylprolyl isomerase [Parvibaculum sp.]|uniref:peptidylprolyl isomerase n=1 Tax=Parvibaculum sp. TaxID=2024848 RepID=UPI0025DB75F4|nr:peptidylprolyl isomerase [Parvibaculum sp.]MCE9651354.1 peptidylprolyl isomerase [Parvibaculum sp.]